MSDHTIAPGARVRIRDAEWLVERVDRTSDGNQVLGVTGLSELVEDKDARFIREIEEEAGHLQLIDPKDTELQLDTSPSFRSSRLYMESLLRKKAPTDEDLYVGPGAAIDPVPYQWKPAIQALDQPRQRTLIADATGLGKTMEAGILMSELIERGQGKRILVVALKSMMTQLQKELWSRFSIPLVRLDSRGIQRIQRRIPAGHNPFYYYDRTIISIDTLKQGAQYRTFVEDAEWDIVVLDEAQNAAKRGESPSQRHRLADKLSRSCDSMIMLSATPHDGSPESFASLMNMLDPTAIADPSDYGKEDIEGLFIRRFKDDIKHQVDSAFLERDVDICEADSTGAEDEVYDTLASLELEEINEEGSGGMLFQTTLEKALFSSPMACLETVENRASRLEVEEDGPAASRDLEKLRSLAKKLQAVGPRQFSKYQRLLSLLETDIDWDGSDPEDRLVIFSERLETLRFLEEHLPGQLGLPEGAVEKLHGGLSDVDQQRVVRNFGEKEASVRLLLASDVAAEGINLHHLCHRLIHFDIPWSLMTFQQRNGRIDRYGQSEPPQIRYMVTKPQSDDIRGDLRILEVLIEKEEQAEANIDDPASLMNVYSVEEEQKVTADAIESEATAEEFDEDLSEDPAEKNPMELILNDDGAGDSQEDNLDPYGSQEDLHSRTSSLTSFYEGEVERFEEALQHLQEEGKGESLDFDVQQDKKTVRLTANEEIRSRFERLPDEIWPQDQVFWLSSDSGRVQSSIDEAREREDEWPELQYLWRLHPLSKWVDDKVIANFRRSEAPVLTLQTLSPEETIVLCSGNVPNRKGQPVVNDWIGAHFLGDLGPEIIPFEEVLSETGLQGGRLANPARDVDIGALEAKIPEAVEEAQAHMQRRRNEVNEQINQDLEVELQRLEDLKARHERQLELQYADSDRPDAIVETEKKRKRRRVEKDFENFLNWVENTMTIEEKAYVQVIAVFTSAE